MSPLSLFPLGAVLFPGGRMSLQVFEPRYLDLVRDSLKRDTPFGIVWIREGREVVDPAGDPMPRLAPIGTFARIVNWDALPNNRLGITVEGGGKFRLLSSEQRADYLVLAEVEPLPEEQPLPLPDRGRELVALLQQLLAHPAIERLQLQAETADAGRHANQLAQLLPIAEARKFELLAEPDPLLRLDRLLLILEQLSE
jgi:Lon protease-like protein